MKSLKPTSTALARILALPVAVGLLAGCDYASKLPDAPTTLGYELQTRKPPSVTAPQGGGLVGPPPPPALQAPPLPAPTQVARLEAQQGGTDLNTQALRVPDAGFEPPRQALALPPAPQLPAPQVRASVEPVSVVPAPETGLARLSTVGTPPTADIDGYVPPPTDFPMAEYQVPQIGVSVQSDAQFPEYAPIPFDSESAGIDPVEVASLQPEPTYQEPEPPTYQADNFDSPTYESAAFAPTTYEPPVYQPPTVETQAYEPPAFQPQTSTVLYSPTPLAEPLPFEAPVDMGGAFTVSNQPAPQQYNSPAPSPIMVLHTRLDNGAVLNVHPVVGAPGAASLVLARTIASELGAPVDQSAVARAPAVFDLRASASRDGGERTEAEWKLFSSTGALVGAFPESQSGGSWSTMGDAAIRSMGRRVADRLRRNADLRRATLTSLASAPPITSMNYGTVLPSGAPSLAPMPRPRPLRMTAPQVAPSQFVVNTAPMIASDPLSSAVPRRRPEGIRTAALAPLAPAAPAPRPIQPVAVAPLPVAPVIQNIPAPQALAPLGAPLPSAPLASAPPVPAPSFDTLRAVTDQAPDGPRSLVFRGVRGAPGNGDQALGREVSRLLAQSGAQLAPNGTPGALYLTADVSRTRGGSSDRIKITWHVEEASGKRVGQVVQENDVPTGALDSNWGEDAFYAAQGARDGIMELLRTSGALKG